jgi:hypothetical protein
MFGSSSGTDEKIYDAQQAKLDADVRVFVAKVHELSAALQQCTDRVW